MGKPRTVGLGQGTNCNNELRNSFTYNYTVNSDREDFETMVEFDPRTIIPRKGLYSNQFNIHGIINPKLEFLEEVCEVLCTAKQFIDFGACVVAVLKFENKDPEACFTKTGITESDAVFAEVSFVKSEDERFVCWGTSQIKYWAGLTSNIVQ
jgi:hypothetical protein